MMIKRGIDTSISKYATVALLSEHFKSGERPRPGSNLSTTNKDGVYSRKTLSMLFVGQVPGLVENFNIGIYSDPTNVINVKLCMMVLLITLSLFIPFSVTLTIFHGHSNIEHF